MKTIIAGSRDITDIKHVIDAVNMCGWNPTAVVCGMARGVDTLGEDWANQNDIPVHCFPANWIKHGKSAGYLRNVQMAQNAEALIAIWDGISRGTGHMIDIAHSHGLKVFVHNPNAEPQLF